MEITNLVRLPDFKDYMLSVIHIDSRKVDLIFLCLDIFMGKIKVKDFPISFS